MSAARVRIARIALPIAAIACAAALAGCIAIPLGQSGGTDTTPATKHPKTSKPAVVSSAAMVGTSLSAGSWKVTVSRARTSSKGPGGAKPAAGKKFLLIESEFRNTGMSQALLVSPKYATLRSPSGKKMAPRGTTQGYNGAGMRAIGPGYGGTTTFIFQVPKGASDYVFVFAPKVGSKHPKLEWSVP